MFNTGQRSIYIPQLTGKPEDQRFTRQSGVLASISSRQRSAITGRPLPEQTDLSLVHTGDDCRQNRRLLNSATIVASVDRALGPAARQIRLCPSQPQYDLHPAMFSSKDSLFLVTSITRLRKKRKKKTHYYKEDKVRYIHFGVLRQRRLNSINIKLT